MLALALLIALTAPAAADVRGAPAAPRWRRPVAGAVARPFAYGADPFRAGWHRGVDLTAPPGTVVRATCSGIVATARPGLVTLRCGRWHVTHLPLASVSVVAGAAVRAGRVVGTVGTSAEHRGLHLGVRREGDRFAYVDPLPFLTAGTPPPPIPAPRTTRIPRSGPGTTRPTVPPAPVRAVPPAPVPASPPAAVRAAPPPGVRVSSPAGAPGLAPWPAWAGLALLLLGVAGGGVRMRVRRRGAALSTPLPSVR